MCKSKYTANYKNTVIKIDVLHIFVNENLKSNINVTIKEIHK